MHVCGTCVYMLCVWYLASLFAYPHPSPPHTPRVTFPCRLQSRHRGVVTPLRGVGVGVVKAVPSGSVSRAPRGEFWNCPASWRIRLGLGAGPEDRSILEGVGLGCWSCFPPNYFKWWPLKRCPKAGDSPCLNWCNEVAEKRLHLGTVGKSLQQGRKP